jgi:hypothetical protein
MMCTPLKRGATKRAAVNWRKSGVPERENRCRSTCLLSQELKYLLRQAWATQERVLVSNDLGKTKTMVKTILRVPRFGRGAEIRKMRSFAGLGKQAESMK